MRYDRRVYKRESITALFQHPIRRAAAIALTSGGLSASAQAQAISLHHISDTHIEGGVEIIAYDAAHDRLHSIGTAGRMVLDFTEEGVPVLSALSIFSDTQQWEATSIAIDPAGRGFGVVSWVPTPPDSVPGMVQVIDLETGTPIWQFSIGYHPDCVMFSPDGMVLYAANEGETHLTDRPGAITVADLSEIESAGDFAGFNSVRTYELNEDHVAAGVDLSVLRVPIEHASNPGIAIEPEYIAATARGAWVSLQENNGLGFFDLQTRAWTRVIPLGTLSFPLDLSESDGARLNSGHGFGLLPLPDTIAVYEAIGRSFIVTANEGEKLDGHEMRLGDAIDRGLIDPVRVQRLREDFEDLGEHGVDRVYISTIDGDLDEDGDIDQICVQGGRSFSIIDETSGVTVWNSGAQIELMTGMLFPGLYNAGDERSDRAGPEPEGIAITRWDDRVFMALGLERTGVVMLYDITNPYAPVLHDLVAMNDGCAAPEGLVFFEREERLMLAVANEIGGCVSIFEVMLRAPE
jgi:hypothetical protein